MGKRSLLLLFVGLLLCVSACKAKSRLPKPAKKKKCDCPRFSQLVLPIESVYVIS